MSIKYKLYDTQTHHSEIGYNEKTLAVLELQIVDCIKSTGIDDYHISDILFFKDDNVITCLGYTCKLEDNIMHPDVWAVVTLGIIDGMAGVHEQGKYKKVPIDDWLQYLVKQWIKFPTMLK